VPARHARHEGSSSIIAFTAFGVSASDANDDDANRGGASPDGAIERPE